MDIDTSIKALPLNPSSTRAIIEEILAAGINDGVHFSISKEDIIMEEHDNPGPRYILNATLERMQEIIKIDISTEDVITPAAIEYTYKLMFEDRHISLWTYNLETILGEKFETMMARGTANTRMRDFYDVFVLYRQEKDTLSVGNLAAALKATSAKRNTTPLLPDLALILQEVRESPDMQKIWESYKTNNFYVEELSWDNVMQTAIELAHLLALYIN